MTRIWKGGRHGNSNSNLNRASHCAATAGSPFTMVEIKRWRVKIENLLQVFLDYELGHFMPAVNLRASSTATASSSTVASTASGWGSTTSATSSTKSVHVILIWLIDLIWLICETFFLYQTTISSPWLQLQCRSTPADCIYTNSFVTFLSWIYWLGTHAFNAAGHMGALL